MSDWIEDLAERHIRKAEAEGKLRGLAGEGKPLPRPEEAAFVDASEAAGFRLMAEHGALPEELVLRRQRDAARDACAHASEAEKTPAMARLAEAEMKLAMAMENRRRRT
ncbi:DUF1992 domain-containing protein [Gymnodinialimonas ceratoperidinii]|uniref:DUF1992 domain-containing protein n=1 Tax=Gymnodinialimonas ceratoperidinii TaxID=2856823 RepID=A0A8F6TZ94_9RHOB|nr:DUF1992 domain-containing protein [Gymnodinialimonas ceratoperidinii]QXT40668.1 DUF1992 domain-containing protein [Gymnodinialimonas ceratoperidinii]